MESFKTRFNVTYDVVSYVQGIATVAEGSVVLSAYNREDAVKHFEAGFRLGGFMWDAVKDAVRVKTVDLVD